MGDGQGGSCEPPEPPLDPPLTSTISIRACVRQFELGTGPSNKFCLLKI